MNHPQPPPTVPLQSPESRTIEVAAMLGDSVQSVKHLGRPDATDNKATTYSFIFAGVLLLVVAATSFLVSLSNANTNKATRHQWTEVDGKPLADYRPERLSLAYDYMAFGGSIGGIVLLGFGLARLRRREASPTFSIGRGIGVDFSTDRVDADSFELVSPRGLDFVVRAAPGMTLETMEVAGPAPLNCQETVVLPGVRYRVSDGDRRFMVSTVATPRRQAAPLFARVERPVAMFAGASLIGHAAFLLIVQTVAPDAMALNDDSLGREGQLRAIRLTAKEDPAQTEPALTGGSEGSQGTAGAKMALTEGLMGTKESANPTGKANMKKRTHEPRLSKDQVMEKSGRAGILGLYSQRPQMFASLTGTGDFSSGADELDIYGGLLGDEAREAAGGWGYGTRDLGPGGGGKKWGTVGTGKWSKIGVCSGKQADCGPSGWGTDKTGNARIRGHRPQGPEVAIGPTHSVGQLDKNTIRRYIRRKLPAIRHCYERGLVSQKDLAGTVMTQFQISPQGAVQGAAAGGIGDKGVESCVRDAVAAIQFPKPKDGGYVNVRYPFQFHSSGN